MYHILFIHFLWTETFSFSFLKLLRMENLWSGQLSLMSGRVKTLITLRFIPRKYVPQREL